MERLPLFRIALKMLYLIGNQNRPYLITTIHNLCLDIGNSSLLNNTNVFFFFFPANYFFFSAYYQFNINGCSHAGQVGCCFGPSSTCLWHHQVIIRSNGYPYGFVSTVKRQNQKQNIAIKYIWEKKISKSQFLNGLRNTYVQAGCLMSLLSALTTKLQIRYIEKRRYLGSFDQ